MQSESENFARDEDINAILGMHRIAVVGISSNPSRDSYGVSRYLKSQGYEIVPVNPNEAEVLGEKSYPSLADLPEPPEVVDVFRRPEAVPEVVDAAITSGAKAVWMQLDVVNPEAARKARDAGLIVVMDRCIMVEHRRRR